MGHETETIRSKSKSAKAIHQPEKKSCTNSAGLQNLGQHHLRFEEVRVEVAVEGPLEREEVEMMEKIIRDTTVELVKRYREEIGLELPNQRFMKLSMNSRNRSVPFVC